MKNRILMPLMIVSILVVGCAAPPPESTPLTEEDVAAIRESLAAVAGLSLAGDCEAMLDLWAEDGMLLPPNAPPVVGRADMLAMCESMTVTEFSSTPVEIDGRDGLAYARGEHSWTFTVEGVDEPSGESGKWIMIWRKQPDGTWLITHDIWNANGE
jgi:ketosteroid isomerase-like protein